MRNNHIARLALVLSLCLCLCGCASEPRQVAVIITSSTQPYTTNMMDGAQRAAVKSGVRLVTYTQVDDDSFITELMGEALEDGADAIIVASNTKSYLSGFIDDIDVPLIAVSTDVWGNAPSVQIGADKVHMASLMGQEMAGCVTRGAKVAILTDSPLFTFNELEMQIASQMGVQGLELVEKRYVGANQNLAFWHTMRLIETHPDLSAILAFTIEGTLGACQAIAASKSPIKVIGREVSDDVLSYIEQGIIQGVIMDNAYGMGFLGVEYATAILSGAEAPQEMELKSVMVNEASLKDPDVCALIFPKDER